MTKRLPVPRSIQALERRTLEFAEAFISEVSSSLGREFSDVLRLYLRLFLLQHFRNDCRRPYAVAKAAYYRLRSRLRVAGKFAKYLSSINKTFKTYSREDVELYLKTASERQVLRIFLKWSVESDMASKTTLIEHKQSSNFTCLDDDQYYRTMHRLYDDESIRLRARCYAIAYISGFKSHLILAVTIGDLDLRRRTILIGGMPLALDGKLLHLFRRLRQERLGRRTIKRASEQYLFLTTESEYVPSSEAILHHLHRQNIRLRILRNTATRLSLQMLPEYLTFAQTTKQSLDGIFALVKRFNGRAASYASVLKE